MLFRTLLWIMLALAGLSLGAGARADPAPPGPTTPPAADPPATPSATAPAKQATVAERAALAPEDPNPVVTAADLAADAGLDQFTGKPIVRVETVTVGRLWRSQERIGSVRAGEAWSGDAARRAVREVLATGRFARAGVEAYPEAGGVVLRLALLPRRVIAGINVSGGALDRAETLEAAGFVEEGEVTATALDAARTRIAALYKSRGFPRAVVNVDATDTDDADRAVVSIEIDPGSPLVIDRRVFFIDKVVQAEVGALRNKYKIDPQLNVFEELLRALGVDRSVRADETVLAEADRELAEVLRQNGFPRAEVRHKVVKKGARVDLQVRITSGPRLLPVFDGNRSFDADQLTPALGLEKGDVSRPADLADRLRDFYVKRGFLDAEVQGSERGGPADAVHYLVFRIYEHRRVRVTQTLFPCLTGELSEGDVKGEIQTFLDEDLPRADGFSPGDPRALLSLFGPTTGAGNRPAPLDIDPATTFAPEPYERALKHLRDLFYSKGYLNAIVGPVSVMRARCDPRRSSEACVPEALPVIAPACGKDDLGLPLPEPKLPVTHRCEPDPARHIDCAPEVTVVLPIHLGPRSVLYDVGFEGNRQVPERELAGIANLTLGQPLSSIELEAARIRLLDFYQARGYAYADVRVTVEPSSDRTRARAKFVIAEHEIVMITGFDVKGAVRTDKKLILGLVELEVGKPYRQDLARLSEEHIASLGTFTSVAIGLQDPEVPQRDKRVVITVVEQLPQYLDPRVGFSTGEGFRLAFEYGHRNLAGQAIALSLRVQLSYLPDLLIADSVKSFYQQEPLSNIGYRLERRNSASLFFHDIGFGSAVGLTFDLLDIHDIQRDYGLTKEAFVPTVTFRPPANRKLAFAGSLSAEYNDVKIFNEEAVNATLSILRVPEGETVAFSQRISGSLDGRDNPFAATRGYFVSAGVEHVNAFPLNSTLPEAKSSHILKLTGRVAGYVPLGITGFSVAMSLSAGYNLPLEPTSKTYADRQFFLGGVDSIRSFSPDSVVPQDIADCIVGVSDDETCFVKKDGQNVRRTIDTVPIRGGDLALNSRIELRFPLPVWSALQGGLFLDAGNLWLDPSTVDLLKFRWGLGLGLRIATPIGPIAFDYGFNLQRYKWEDFGAPNFSIGLF